MRTYGTLRFDDGRWLMDTEPHVVLRVKRIFPKVSQYGRHVRFSDTVDVARELVWVLDRWPMVMDDTTAAYLHGRAAQYHERERVVERILDGYTAPLPREPARPAKPHQVQAAQIVHQLGRVLLADELGTGKTQSGVMTCLGEGSLPALVVVQTALPRQWCAEFRAVAPWLTTHIVESMAVYDPADKCGGRVPDVVVCTYSKLSSWGPYLAGNVRTVVFDEAQELRRPGTAKYEGARAVAAEAAHRMALTGTPVFNYGDDIFHICNVIAPGELGSWDEFTREWCVKNDKGRWAIQHPEAFGAFLRDSVLMLARSAEDVGMSPACPPVRIQHEIDLDERTLTALTDDIVGFAQALVAPDTPREERWHAASQFDWRMRRATGVAKAPYVARFVEMLIETGQPVVLFGWHRDVYTLWEKRLARHRPAFITGAETPGRKAESKRRFVEGETDLLIMSLHSGAGMDGLQHRSHVVVFGELDWTPGIHHQCLGRLSRYGQKHQVLGYFLVATSGADPSIAEVLDLKRQQAEPIMDPDGKAVVPLAAPGPRLREMAERFLRAKGVAAPATRHVNDDSGDEDDEADDEKDFEALDEQADPAEDQGEDQQDDDELGHGDLPVASRSLYAITGVRA